MSLPIEVAQLISMIPTLQETIRLEINQNQIVPHQTSDLNYQQSRLLSSTVVEISESLLMQLRRERERRRRQGWRKPVPSLASRSTPLPLPRVEIVV